MLLEREDVTPSYGGVESHWTPISGAVDMPSEWSDGRTAKPDNKSHTPLSLALSRGHDGVVKILQDWGNANSNRAEHHDQMSPPLSTRHGDERLVEAQFRCDDPDSDILSLNDQLASPSVDGNEREVVLDLKDSAPKTRRYRLLNRTIRAVSTAFRRAPKVLAPSKEKQPSP